MGGSPQLARLSHQQKTSGLQKKSQWHNCIDMSARAPFVLCARYFLNQDLETLNFFFYQVELSKSKCIFWGQNST